MALPASIGYCTITGRFIRTLLDGPDPDRDPDTVPIAGLKIEIKADLRNPSIRHAASKTTILMDSINVTTNSDGELVGADSVPSIKVVAGDNPALGIFTYTARISGPTYPTQTLTFDAPTGGTRDLSDLVEVPAAPGATLNAWLEAKNTTLAARDELVTMLDEGVLAGPKGDQGERGIQGLQGIQGLKGDKGDTGERGLQGIQGIAGTAGAKGDTGAQGIQGVKGDTGSTGAPGTPADTTVLNSKVGSNGTVTQIVKLTQAQYDAISSKVATTLYVIVG